MFEQNRIRQADAQACLFVTMPTFDYIRITEFEI